MLVVRDSLPKVEADPERGWQIVFRLGDAFDYSTPFRYALSVIASTLGERAYVELDLPDYDPDEDFVEGLLRFGAASVNVYFEFSLGYLALTSRDRAILEELVARLLPSIQVV